MSIDIKDPIEAGLARGWKAEDAATWTSDRVAEVDVVIVGSGAGGGVTAEILSLAGLSVAIVEEGALRSSKDFKMREADAYPQLYQESAARHSADKSVLILQGRTVGGSTTVNWTSSFRTPATTLAWWQARHGISAHTEAALEPWFELMEARLGIAPWPTPPNENNSLLKAGADKLGIPTGSIRRNVRGCWNLGYCGMGCPVNAKQSMLVTTIPSALEHGARLYSHARAQRFVFDGDRIDRFECQALGADGITPTGRTLTLRARHFVLAAGGIGSPGLLLRSGAPDPSGQLGKRTFLHPTVVSLALFPQRVDGFAGAPQSIYSDHFLDLQPPGGPVGYKLEAPPLHPLLVSTLAPSFGREHADLMQQFPHMHAQLALLRDGFHDDAPGGTVRLGSDQLPQLDYPLNDYLWDGVRRALLSMAEIQFAAGASSVLPLHIAMPRYRSWAEAKQGIAGLPLAPGIARVGSAHVMGGCAMSGNPRRGVVDEQGRYRGLANLSVHDGSVFPTSLGTNPQLTIYGVTARMASLLAEALTGRPAPRPVAA